MYSLLALLILVRATVNFGYVGINVIHMVLQHGHMLEFDWECQKQIDAIHTGNYDPKKCLFYDATKADDGRIFITTSKEFGSTCPAILNIVTKKMGKSGGPLLRPFPDWSWHNNSCKCSEKSIVNVNRIYIRCNHLFVLDTGKIGIKDQICNPKLLIFDLKNDTLVRTIYIPIDIAGNRTGSVFLLTPVVYVPERCSRLLDEMIVFMADMQGFGLVVYNSFTKRICRVESDFMKPTRNNFVVGKQTVPYICGIYSMTILGDGKYFLIQRIMLHFDI